MKFVHFAWNSSWRKLCNVIKLSHQSTPSVHFATHSEYRYQTKGEKPYNTDKIVYVTYWNSSIFRAKCIFYSIFTTGKCKESWNTKCSRVQIIAAVIFPFNIVSSIISITVNGFEETESFKECFNHLCTKFTKFTPILIVVTWERRARCFSNVGVMKKAGKWALNRRFFNNNINSNLIFTTFLSMI